tara:strand:- start:16 stop:1275 length:1260 start_codon:yes stop_codon:yes gene_type:complete
MISAIIGAQWGDEGKGKIVDLLSKDAKIVARFQGGANAGHTVYYNNQKIVLHQIPSGILRDNCECILGNGMVVDPIGLVDEIKMVESYGVKCMDNIHIATNAHIVTPIHKEIDLASEKASNNKIGTTGRGIGPTYVDKYDRNGLRASELGDESYIITHLQKKLDKSIKMGLIEASKEQDIKQMFPNFISACQQIHKHVSDVFRLLHESKGNILIEGAQGTLLDIDHGTYPYVTSSNASSAGIGTGLGFPMNKVDSIIGIFKAYTTRVGKGPFPTELFDNYGKTIRDVGKEYGATTGRERRCGWFDGVAAKYTCLANGFTDIALTKLDVLDGFDSIKVCTHYEINGEQTSSFSKLINQLDLVKPIYERIDGWDSPTAGVTNYCELPENAKIYIDYLSRLMNTKISIISTGPGRNEIIKID